MYFLSLALNTFVIKLNIMTFQELQPKISSIITDNQINRDEKLLAICQLLNENIEYYNWVGFYFANHDTKTLHLGP